MMRFIRYSYKNSIGYGTVSGDHVQPISSNFLGEGWEASGSPLALSDVTVLSPVSPSKAVCVGMNYHTHMEEMKASLPVTPVIFIKPDTCVIGPGQEIIPPTWLSGRTDYEGELVIVIGRTAKNVSEKDAPSYIFGYTIGNDVTARDLQDPHGQWTVAKGFDTFLPLGPAVVTGVDVSDVTLETRVNGKVKQSSTTANLIFKPAYLVSYISQVMTLKPGDIIMTGTPGGIGSLAGGDVVEITIEGIGTLSNPVKK
ncbi:fumarylacetoacetate hydrolase family protein [Parasphaerochaeta coccoides]|uniref:5-carboxymethyl-2-hydroxymuconate Delta-isomerase n=1 Tax=Parasphaerochaeta coccoides (strain ATCC BAA-1237 / DSM 17374 / SPN1) TaxID=760011 RepID=F4GKN0_PARC1|nr:fumarylacetoacetate hydrolase family protein [Parasphaerochaeta coccoides]AEC01439.1 5-carboxymethyl-2-hydroxymuconate Delta-isomerase [Parasphaerochaeta coccoides DSM 17374]